MSEEDQDGFSEHPVEAHALLDMEKNTLLDKVVPGACINSIE
jgi:hypothetical protein